MVTGDGPTRDEIEAALADLDLDGLEEPDRDADPPEVGPIGVLSVVANGGDVRLLDRDRRLGLVAGERRRLTEPAVDLLLSERDERDGGGE